MSFRCCVVINDYHLIISGEKGAGYSSKSSTTIMWVVLAMTAMAPQFAYIMNRKLQPDSNVPRIHIILHVMKGSHASMMAQFNMVDTDKYRLGGIPPSSCEPPDVGLTRIQ